MGKLLSQRFILIPMRQQFNDSVGNSCGVFKAADLPFPVDVLRKQANNIHFSINGLILISTMAKI